MADTTGKLIVTGATGTLGGLVVERLLERVDPGRVAVSITDPARAQALADRGVRVRRGDFGDPASLADAFAGAQRVLVISPAVVGAQAVAYSSAAIDAAKAAGAERILYTSHQGASPDSPFPPMPVHAAVERHLAQSGVPYTALRHGFYASTVPLLAAGARETGALVAPEDGPVSWTTHADLAEAAARALAGETDLDGVTAPLTGPEALDLAAVAELLGVRRVVAGDEEYAETLVARGAPRERADMLVGMFRASRAGEFDVVDPALGSVLGRAPGTLREVLA